MATTLKDVARLAQVSVKTVSNVVHGHPHVSEDVRHRVETAIRRLGYRPNVAARALRAGRGRRGGLLALAVPGVDHPPGLVEELVRLAAPLGFRVMIQPVGSCAPDPADVPGVDAVLVNADAPPPALADACVAAGTPLVLLGGGPDPRFDCVGADAARMIRDAVVHLLSAGRRRVAAIGTCSEGMSAGFRDAGLTPPPGFLRLTHHHRPADGYLAARELLLHTRPPDAVVCGSDRLASGVLRAAADAGLRVPGDLAVTGAGDGEEGRYTRPALTTVAADPAVIAGRALDLVTRRLAGVATVPVRVVVPHALLVRESSVSLCSPVPPNRRT
ncbi:LacI family transcriptional regulator [Couchioplanes caeruleus]|uniref:LacI family DNA-binding transcriptional regulator n=1 Tax=Couchioplanes caeruleus TaxID=56438 RepID=UPI0020BF941B|nr:LacI family DNA-binding transcriptional regulator [Couchioplanes caeruleus]UQU67793.1 LacI family transcriptional regulator [Couchioplanes caeruleus]